MDNYRNGFCLINFGERMLLQKLRPIVFILICLFCSNSFAVFHDKYISLDLGIAGANGEVTNDIASVTLEYQKQVDFIKMFPTAGEYHWYFDAVIAGAFYEIEDPIKYLKISGTSLDTADLTATDYVIEFGLTRRQAVYDSIFWILGARLGGFIVDTNKISGQTNTAQNFNVESNSTVGLTISAHSGLSWSISENYMLDTFLQLRKYYLNEFTVQDTVSGAEYKYPDFTSIGFSIGISRGF